jgi:substrate import-associated zinc metallohydrolase lipoprotein
MITTMNATKKISELFIFGTLLFAGCYPEDDLNVPKTEVTPSDDEIDQYIQDNWIDEYGVAVRFKYVDRYVDPTKRVTPPKRELVMPMLDFLNEFWIEPFQGVDNGEEFFREHVPAEIVFIGSAIYNGDGTITLGTADAGARITLTEVNILDMENQEWIFRQLGTIYHEWAHIVHQRYNLPPNWQDITPNGYTSSGSWYNLTDEEALQRGFVSPYGTSSYNEDFAELVAFLLFYPDFYDRYITPETNCTDVACQARNDGRAKLEIKLNAILTHYKTYTGVDLEAVREIVQEKLQ